LDPSVRCGPKAPMAEGPVWRRAAIRGDTTSVHAS
jgi:hypothetical protein